MSDQRGTTPHRGTVTIAVVAVLLGAGVLTGLVYTELTAGSVTEADYTEFRQNCGDLTNQSGMVDAGLGMEPVELNETHVAACENTTFAAYSTARRQSFRATPLSLRQWALYGGSGAVMLVGGVIVLRRQYALVGQ